MNASAELSLCGHFGSRCQLLIDVRIAAASLSLVGCVFIIAAVVLFQRYRSFAQRLILYLTVASLLDALPYFDNSRHPRPGPLCTLQALVMTYADWAVLLWISLITLNVYLNLMRQVDTAAYERRYHLVAWGVPLLPAFLPLIFNVYGPAGAWCWIKSTEDGWRLGVWYAPMLLLIGIVAVSYAVIQRAVIKSTASWRGTYRPEMEEENLALRKQVQALVVYPLIYVAVSLFAIINRIQNAVAPDHPVLTLYILHSFFSPMQGLINAVAYAMADGLWQTCTPQSITRAWARRGRPVDMREIPMLSDDETGDGMDDVHNFGLSEEDDDDDEEIAYMTSYPSNL